MINVKYIINENGEKTHIIIPFSDFQKLMEEIARLKVISEKNDKELVIISELDALFN
mgnify:CR=1 FL=1